MDEQVLRDNPFEPQPHPRGQIWFDPDLDKFLVAPLDVDGCDEADEYDTFAEATA